MVDRELANLERSFRALGDAFVDAAARIGDPVDGSANVAPQHIVLLERELVRRDLEIDAAGIEDAMIALVALQATKTRETPRQVWERLWKGAPSDGWWRAATTTKGDEDAPGAG